VRLGGAVEDGVPEVPVELLVRVRQDDAVRAPVGIARYPRLLLAVRTPDECVQLVDEPFTRLPSALDPRLVRNLPFKWTKVLGNME
jgi:hypothetical protein